MTYLIKKEDLDRLIKNQTTVDELLTPSNIALVTYSGEDVISRLKDEKIKLSKNKILQLIIDIQHRFDSCPCSGCFSIIFDDVIKHNK